MKGLKLGVQMHHAEQLKGKVDEDDCSRLTIHLNKYYKALELAPDRYSALSDQQITSRVAELCVKEGIPVPDHLQRHFIVKAAGRNQLDLRFGI
eukprot:1656091-Pyramimonas_sp.AAC.1